MSRSSRPSLAGAGMEGSQRTLRPGHDAGGGILAGRTKDRQGSSGWRFTWGSAE